MKNDLNDLKKLTLELIKGGNVNDVTSKNEGLIEKIYGEPETTYEEPIENAMEVVPIPSQTTQDIIPSSENSLDKYHFAEEIEEEETLSLQDKELELIKKSLERHNGKRKLAATELGISERTLYRKIKQYDL